MVIVRVSYITQDQWDICMNLVHGFVRYSWILDEYFLYHISHFVRRYIVIR